MQMAFAQAFCYMFMLHYILDEKWFFFGYCLSRTEKVWFTLSLLQEVLAFKVIPQKLKLPMNVFETFPECSLPSIVSKNTTKMMGHPSRLRDMMGQSHPIYGCTRANYVRYSSVQVIFCGSSKHNLLKWYLGKNLTGRKCRAHGTIPYEICQKIMPFKTT